MYESFFQLLRKPFEVSPDPFFYYGTAQHQEALAGLYFGVTARRGFVVLSGEVGTGKTLVLRCLMDRLDADGIHYAYVFNSILSPRDFLHYVAEDLHMPLRGARKSSLLLQYSRFLIERHSQGHTTVLIVDEAQHLSPSVLEEIRLLTNLETPQGKLLQILLVGQPELDATLESNSLRQLRQRITLRFRLRPLNQEELRGYIAQRIQLAGGSAGLLPPETMARIFHYSRGVPRLANTLCDNAFVAAYSLGQKRISPELVDEAAADLALQPEEEQPRKRRRSTSRRGLRPDCAQPESSEASCARPRVDLAGALAIS